MAIDLNSYLFPLTEYDPTENPRGVVTSAEWNTILKSLQYQTNYMAGALKDLFGDIYSKSQLAATTIGEDGSRLIGVDAIPGVDAENINEALRDIKNQLDNVALGDIPNGSLGSEKLAENLEFAGTSLKFNNKQILTTDQIVNTLTGNDVAKASSVASVVAALSLKQDKYSKGTTPPDQNTPGDLYFMYIA